MITDKLLSDVFAEQAENRPEARQVLAAVHDRVDGRSTVMITRSATAFGAAAAVAAIAIGSSVIGHHGSGHTITVGGGSSTAAAASSTPQSSSPSSPQPSSPTAATPSPSATPTSPASSNQVPSSAPSMITPTSSVDYSTIAAGWLPGPVTHEAATNNGGFEEHDYTVTVDGTEVDVIIWVEAGSTLPTRMQATGGGSDYSELTVQGHPAREFVSANITIVAIDLGNGRIAYAGPSVQTTTGTVTTARITSIAVQVANGIEYGRHDPLPSN